MKDILLTICKFIGLFNVSEWLTKKKLRILCYHNFSIGDEPLFKPLLHIKKETFIKRLEYLKKKNFQFTSLNVAVQRLKDNELTDKNIVITFDDGWYLNLKFADPILKDNDIPYTIYVATGYVSENVPIPNIIIPFFFEKTSLDLFKILKKFSEEWNTPFEDIDDLRLWLIAKFKQYENRYEKIEFLKKIGSILNVPAEQIIQNRIFNYLTPDEIKKMNDEGVDFQLHTHSHYFPSDKEIASKEIDDNFNFIEKLLGTTPQHFCYPSGRVYENHIDILKNKPILSAVTCKPGMNTHKTPILKLHRFLDSEDISQIVFEAEVSGFLSLFR